MQYGSGRGAVRRLAFLLLAALGIGSAAADIPAAPVLTLYRFNGDLNLPYYHVQRFEGRGSVAPAGLLAQGTTVIPCLVIRNGRPVTDRSGTPYVGFEVVADPRTATRESTERVRAAIAQRKTLRTENHHCEGPVEHVIDVRNLYAMEKVPFFEPPPMQNPVPDSTAPAQSAADRIVRAFHNSAQCAAVNDSLTGRRDALRRAWDEFERANRARWSGDDLVRARHLDYTLRTALYEGHLERGCNAYGACERNVVALTIRNRAFERCFGREGCRASGDITGVASKVSQYNIWDEYLTQISGLTACYLRDDLAGEAYFRRLQAMHAQNVVDVERILFGSDADLAELFPGVPLDDLKRTAHYYHAPAMGKCFPGHPRVEYMSGAVAQSGNNFALLVNTRIEVGDKVGDGYRFKSFRFEETDLRDVVEVRDDYPGFIVDGRKVTLAGGGRCAPYGIPAGCPLGEIGRYRRTPPWLEAGRPIGLTCRIADRGESCSTEPRLLSVEVGGACDTQMRPVSGVH